MTNKKQYKISVVMAVYKCEKFLAETLNSIISQTLDFEKNIQLILVNDGSPDSSGEICDNYKAKYPNNIVVIHKENGGVASARDAGLKVAEGKYVNFCDSDDKMGKDAFEKMYNFFEKHYEETNIVTIPIYFFGELSGSHYQNDKFKKGTRIIDLKQEPQFSQFFVTSTMFKTSQAKQVKFDPSLIHGEDAKFILEIIAEKPTMGVVADTSFYYRRHDNSLITTAKEKKENYTTFVKNFALWAFDYFNKKLGFVPRFVQHVVMWDLHWFFRNDNAPSCLTEKENNEFKETLYSCMNYIDDDIILYPNFCSLQKKLFCLQKKHKKDNRIILNISKNIIYKLGEIGVLDSDLLSVSLNFFRVQNDEAHIEGRFVEHAFLSQPKEIYLEVDGKKYTCPLEKTEQKQLVLGEEYGRFYNWSCKFDTKKLKNFNYIKFYYRLEDGQFIQIKKFVFSQLFPLTNQYANSYFYENGWILRGFNNMFIFEKSSKLKLLKREIKFSKSLLFTKNKNHLKIFLLRLYYILTKPFHKKPIWLISDRINKAGDNGEALFRYISKLNDKSIKCYFSIDKCLDYKQMKKVGPTIKRNSFKSHITYLRAKNIISSHADHNTFVPFGCAREGVKDIIAKQNHVFLQHGVTKDDLSDWLNRYKKDLKGIITAAKPEANSFINYEYDYKKDRIWLTGFPRFDRLENEREKIITVMPTWRKYLMSSDVDSHGLRKVSPNFTSSDFYKFYNGIINNPKLITVAKKHNYKIQFMPHPIIITSIDLFEKNDFVTFLSINTPYKEIFSKSALILTDYSSTPFDFAYLKKPVVYCQFDKETFFSGQHSYTQGYFDYERDGFGEVMYNLDDTINLLIDYIENDCKLKDKYEVRIKNFFAFDDKNNSERVYKKIKELK